MSSSDANATATATNSRRRRWTDHGWGKLLKLAGIACNVVAIVALVVAIIGLTELTANRRDSARDSCRLMLGLVRTATPPGRSALAEAYINRTPLHDCNTYAKALVQ